MISLSVLATEWEIPVGTRFSGHNITARFRTHNMNFSPRSYVDLSIKISPGVLQGFQYYIHNPFRTARSQQVKFLVWQLNSQEFLGRARQRLFNSSVTLKYELEFVVGTQPGVYTVICTTAIYQSSLSSPFSSLLSFYHSSHLVLRLSICNTKIDLVVV